MRLWNIFSVWGCHKHTKHHNDVLSTNHTNHEKHLLPLMPSQFMHYALIRPLDITLDYHCRRDAGEEGLSSRDPL